MAVLYCSTPSVGLIQAAMSERRLGCMTTPKQGNGLPPHSWYAADNGKFGKGWPGADKWWAWLSKTVDTYSAERCLFATAPDVMLDPVGTLLESAPWLPRIRDLGVPAAYVAQDGSENGLIPWGDFDVLFLGGSTEWKLSIEAWALSREAILRGTKVHMGRVNSLKRLRIAITFGAATADGTYLAFGPNINFPKVMRWMEQLEGPHHTPGWDPKALPANGASLFLPVRELD